MCTIYIKEIFFCFSPSPIFLSLLHNRLKVSFSHHMWMSSMELALFTFSSILLNISLEGWNLAFTFFSDLHLLKKNETNVCLLLTILVTLKKSLWAASLFKMSNSVPRWGPCSLSLPTLFSVTVYSSKLAPALQDHWTLAGGRWWYTTKTFPFGHFKEIGH